MTTPAQTPENETPEHDLEFDLVESQEGAMGAKLNWLRAAVLGANDGIVSTAGIVMGVSGAAFDNKALFAAGIAGMVAGALSMAAGEYVSVSTQRDTERAELDRQKKFIHEHPVAAERKLAGLIAGQGLSRPLAVQAARELTERDPLDAHARYELGMDPEELANPWHAAWASMLAFAVGAIIPLFTILFTPANLAVPITGIAVTVALAITGSISARLGGAPWIPATIRNVLGGNVAMGVTYLIGTLFA